MKIWIGFLLGIIFSILSLYFIPQLQLLLPQVKALATPDYGQNYSHDAEGKKLQSVDFIEGEAFRSTEGNEATLYQLSNQCKLTLSIYGESYLSHLSFYFHHGKIISAFETTETYPNGGFYAEFKDNKAFETQQEFLKIMNPAHPETTNIFNAIAHHFKPSLIQHC